MGGAFRISHGSVLIFLTLSLLVLTCLQASGSILTTNFRLVNQSRGYSIFFLRTFSELAGVSLSATISTTLERIKWAMICRQGAGRARFVDFLALQHSTTLLGLLSLAAGAGVPSIKTRLWSAIRLLLMILVPGIGILIMSQVEIGLAFSPVSSTTRYFGYDNHPMNATSALEYTSFTDLILSWKFAGFLGDPTRSVDLTPDNERGKVCSLNVNAQDSLGCNRTFFVAGENMLVMPELVRDASFPDADVILASDHRGFLLNFNAGNSSAVFNSTRDCRTYSSRYLGFQAGAIRLCVGNSGPHELEARLVTCPGSIASTLTCLNDTSWHNNVDWTIKMSVMFQNSQVAYSRSNGTILWHSFTDTSPVPVDVLSTDILKSYDALLLDTSTLLFNGSSSGNVPLFSSSSFPTFLWLAEPEFSDQNAINPATSNAIYSTLQSLLAAPMYYCQSGVARRLIPAILDAKTVNVPELTYLFGLLSAPPERNSPASFAHHRYEVKVSFETLIAYIVLSGTALLACSIAHTVISLSDHVRHGRRLPRLSRFPTLDLFAHCTIEDENRCVIYQGRSGFFPTEHSPKSLKRWLSTISIKWSQPHNMEDGGLQLFGDECVEGHGDWSSISMGSISPIPSRSKLVGSMSPYSSRTKLSLFRSND